MCDNLYVHCHQAVSTNDILIQSIIDHHYMNRLCDNLYVHCHQAVTTNNILIQLIIDHYHMRTWLKLPTSKPKIVVYLIYTSKLAKSSIKSHLKTKKHLNAVSVTTGVIKKGTWIDMLHWFMKERGCLQHCNK